MSSWSVSKVVPLFVVGLAGLTLAGCSTYGSGDFGYYGRSHPNAGYGSPYSYGRGSVYGAPYGYDRGRSFGYGVRGYSNGHSGLGIGGRRH